MAKRTQAQLDEMLQDAIDLVRGLELQTGFIQPEVKITNGAREFGRCTQYAPRKFVISISKYIKDNDKDELMNTFIHEVLHTVKGCFNHGPNWKAAAHEVKQKHGYSIDTKSAVSISELSAEHQAVLKRYIIKCQDCGQEIYRQRKCKIVNYPGMYTCGKCGGELKLVKGGE